MHIVHLDFGGQNSGLLRAIITKERKKATHYDEYETCSSSDCPYRDIKYTYGDYYDHYHITHYNIFRNKKGRGGVSFRIGISF